MSEMRVTGENLRTLTITSSTTHLACTAWNLTLNSAVDLMCWDAMYSVDHWNLTLNSAVDLMCWDAM